MTQQKASIFWYDLETTGTQPKWDRIIQFAGIRTTEDLQETKQQISFFIRLSEDILPGPEACLVTRLSPQTVNEKGLSEPHALSNINELFSAPRTCVAGYNSLRFDDEFIRFGFYRNFIDSYSREWRNQNSRWDLIDLVRATAALRPEGIHWPLLEGLPSYKLEELTKANGLEHGRAHDALSDVKATIALARLIRQRQPRLYKYFYALRRKSAVQSLVLPLKQRILFHVSRMYRRERLCLAPIASIARHPVNSNAVIVLDLAGEIGPVLEWPAEKLAQHLFKRGSAYRPPMKEVRLNHCPFLAPVTAMRESDEMRLGVDMSRVNENFLRITEDARLEEKIADVYRRETEFAAEDVEGQLYEGFFGNDDRRGCDAVRRLFIAGKDPAVINFEDPRLTELLFRFRARNHPAWLDSSEQERWRSYLTERLYAKDETHGRSFNQFFNEIDELEKRSSDPLLSELRSYGKQLQRTLNLAPAALKSFPH